LDEIIDRRAQFLTDYQDAATRKRYVDFVAQGRARGNARQPGATDLTEAVARYYFKLLAIKDEYEVARLYAETDFVERVASQFEGDYKLNFHLAPPTLNKPDAKTGVAKKTKYGPMDDVGVSSAGEAAALSRDRVRLFRALTRTQKWSAR
jgi:indolepyruvate ferredoxin oxidoreductase